MSHTKVANVKRFKWDVLTSPVFKINVGKAVVSFKLRLRRAGLLQCLGEFHYELMCVEAPANLNLFVCGFGATVSASSNGAVSAVQLLKVPQPLKAGKKICLPDNITWRTLLFCDLRNADAWPASEKIVNFLVELKRGKQDFRFEDAWTLASPWLTVKGNACIRAFIAARSISKKEYRVVVQKRGMTQDVGQVRIGIGGKSRIVYASLDELASFKLASFKPNDNASLMFYIDTTAVDGRVSPNSSASGAVFMAGQQRMTNLLQSVLNGENAFADCELRINGAVYMCHRAILCSFPYFQGKFNVEPTASTVTLPTMANAESAEEILRYFYIGRVTRLDRTALDLLAVAHELMLDDLKAECGQALAAQVTVDNALSFYVMGERLGCMLMKCEARKIVVANIEEIQQKAAWKEFMLGNTDLVSELLANVMKAN